MYLAQKILKYWINVLTLPTNLKIVLIVPSKLKEVSAL